MTRMPSSKKSGNASGTKSRVVRKRLADGTIKEYRYDRDRTAKVPRSDPRSLQALISAYRQSPEFSRLKPRTKTSYLSMLGYLEAAGDLPANGLRRKHVLEIRDGHAASVGSGSANTLMRVFSTLLSWGVDREWLPFNVASRIPQLPSVPYQAWTADQVEHAITNFPSHLARLVMVAAYTGQRKGDLIKMRWADYDGNAITVVQEKRKIGYPEVTVVIPVHPRLKSCLDEWRRLSNCEYILTTSRGTKWHRNSPTSLMQKEVEKSGFPEGLNVHGLRKYAATTLAEAGCSAHEIASITGHLSIAMVQHYTKSADQKRLAEAAIGKLQTAKRKPL